MGCFEEVDVARAKGDSEARSRNGAGKEEWARGLPLF